MTKARLLPFVLLLSATGCASSAAVGAATKGPTSPGQALTPGLLPTDAAPAAHEPKTDPREGAELLGTIAPEWVADHWMNSPPLPLSSLRGKVVLVRWWTAGCPYCSASAPALREFDKAYGDKGLVVVGFYHHKEPGPLDYAGAEGVAKRYGFTFPVAVDGDWKTLESWWQVKAKQRDFTSVSFLLDRQGIIRHIHPGGAYIQGEPGYVAMKSAIEKVLSEGAR